MNIIQEEVERHYALITRNCVDIIEPEELKTRLKSSIESKTPLKIKYGIDPTSPQLHLGHMILVKKLRDFQLLGHTILFLIGDFTARIGDPTGRNETRPILSSEDIQKNLSSYREQVSGILDLEKVSFVYNAAWLEKIPLKEFIHISSAFTIAQILERDDFFARYRQGKPIYFHEFMYPLFQGYDSVALKADIEIGATEQKFNLLAGRTLQHHFGQKKQIVLTTPILVGTDGKLKMSKSYENHIPVSTTAEDMYGKLMSIPDSIMENYFQLLTSKAPHEYQSLIKEDPRKAKDLLAREVVSDFFNVQQASSASEEFQRVFSQKKAPSEIQICLLPPESLDSSGEISIVDLLYISTFVSSRADAKRLIAQNAVQLNGTVLSDPLARVAPLGKILKVGKRRFARIEKEQL